MENNKDVEFLIFFNFKERMKEKYLCDRNGWESKYESDDEKWEKSREHQGEEWGSEKYEK